MFCPNCGTELKDDDKFCIICGTNISNIDLEDENKSYPPESSDNTTKKSSSKNTFVYIAVILVALLVICLLIKIFTGKNKDVSNSDNNYITDESNSIKETDTNGIEEINEDSSIHEEQTTNENIYDSKSTDSLTSDDWEDELDDISDVYPSMYGYWDNDGTRYALAFDLDGLKNYFCLSIVRYNGPAAYLEGSYVENGDNTKTAKITLDDFDDNLGKEFTIISKTNEMEIVSNDENLQYIVGVYPYVGVDYEDLEKLNPKATYSEDEYILPSSDYLKLTDSDLAGLSAQELTYARNEIYARHGYVFKSNELNNYFRRLSWYSPIDDNNKIKLNSMEKENMNYIKTFQENHGLEYTPQ